MQSFPVHTLESAPEESKPSLQTLRGVFGRIPNIAGAMSTSPVLIGSLVGLFQKVHGGSFSEAEIQVLLLTNAVTNSRMIAQHEPYPAIVMDRYWNVLRTNDAAPRFFSCFIDMSTRTSPRNMLHLMFDPTGMRPFIADWESLARTLIQRVHREAVGHMVDHKTKDLVTDLLAYPDVPSDWRAPDGLSVLPMIPMRFVKDGAAMNYFSLVTTVGTPQTVAAQELRVECIYPADDETEVLHAKLLAGHRPLGKRST